MPHPGVPHRNARAEQQCTRSVTERPAQLCIPASKSSWPYWVVQQLPSGGLRLTVHRAVWPASYPMDE